MDKINKMRALVGAGLISAVVAGAAIIAGCSKDSPLSNVGSAMANTGLLGRHGQEAVGYAQAGGELFQAANMSEKDEEPLGRSVVYAVTSDHPVVDIKSLSDYVTKVGLIVAAASPAADQDTLCYFAVLDADTVNSYAGPHGYIMITRGAIAKCHDESELAGLLAHEVAHVALHHGLNSVKTGHLVNAGQTAGQAAMSNSRAGSWGGMVDLGVDVIVKNGYSQSQENEADAASVKYLEKAGYDPAGLANLLDRVSRDSHGGSDMFSTHPGLAARVKNIRSIAGNATGQTLQARFTKNTAALKPNGG